MVTRIEETQRRIRRLEAEIDRLQRQAVMDQQFVQARADKLAHLKQTLDAKRRSLARLEAHHA